MTDFTQFPKNRGAFNGPGRQDARELANSGVAFLKKRRVDGSVAEKKGDFLYVSDQRVLEDGFYSLGLVEGATRIVGSPTARGTFTDRGPAPTAGGFVVSQLAFYGKGLGNVVKNGMLGSFLDFDGRACQMFTSVFSRTRDGRALTDYYDVNLFIPFGAPNTQSFSVPGGYHDLGGTPTFWAGQVYSTLLGDGQHVQLFVRDDGNGDQVLGDTAYLPDQLGWYADPIRLNPSTLLKMDRYRRPHYTPSSVDAAACPGLYFTYTADAGATWAEPASNALFQDELDTLTDMDVSLGDAVKFNDAVANADLRSAPLSRELSIVLARVPYIEDVAGVPTVKVRVKLGLCNVAAGCALTETAVLFDGDPADAAVFAGRGLLGIPGGALLFTRPITGDLDEWNHPMRIQRTVDGMTLTDVATMPLPEYRTGVPSAFSTSVLACPMYDEDRFLLYDSLDWGATWRKRAVISANGTPPDPADQDYVMAGFPVITYLRRDGRPANALPATPWLHDIRVAAP